MGKARGKQKKIKVVFFFNICFAYSLFVIKIITKQLKKKVTFAILRVLTLKKALQLCRKLFLLLVRIKSKEEDRPWQSEISYNKILNRLCFNCTRRSRPCKWQNAVSAGRIAIDYHVNVSGAHHLHPTWARTCWQAAS